MADDLARCVTHHTPCWLASRFQFPPLYDRQMIYVCVCDETLLLLLIKTAHDSYPGVVQSTELVVRWIDKCFFLTLTWHKPYQYLSNDTYVQDRNVQKMYRNVAVYYNVSFDIQRFLVLEIPHITALNHRLFFARVKCTWLVFLVGICTLVYLFIVFFCPKYHMECWHQWYRSVL